MFVFVKTNLIFSKNKKNTFFFLLYSLFFFFLNIYSAIAHVFFFYFTAYQAHYQSKGECIWRFYSKMADCILSPSVLRQTPPPFRLWLAIYFPWVRLADSATAACNRMKQPISEHWARFVEYGWGKVTVFFQWSIKQREARVCTGASVCLYISELAGRGCSNK